MVEVRQGAGGEETRRGEEKRGEEEEEEDEKREEKEEDEDEEEATDIKSNNPHLAGGEILKNILQKSNSSGQYQLDPNHSFQASSHPNSTKMARTKSKYGITIKNAHILQEI